jgi:hypothetical protein
MKAFFGVAAVAAALVSWQPMAHATMIGVTTEKSQPLTRAACDKAGLAWDESGNVCDWHGPKEQLASESTPDIIPSSQPLTRAACDKAGLAWDESGNVCDWHGPKEQLASEPTPDITGAITSAQRLTRADCDRAGLLWDHTGNVCAG